MSFDFICYVYIVDQKGNLISKKEDFQLIALGPSIEPVVGDELTFIYKFIRKGGGHDQRRISLRVIKRDLWCPNFFSTSVLNPDVFPQEGLRIGDCGKITDLTCIPTAKNGGIAGARALIKYYHQIKNGLGKAQGKYYRTHPQA